MAVVDLKERNRRRKRLGAVLRERRKERGLSQIALAQQAGLSSSQLSRVELGEESPTVEELDACEGALGVDTGQLLSEAGYTLPTLTPETLTRLLADAVELPPQRRSALLTVVEAFTEPSPSGFGTLVAKTDQERRLT